MEKSRTDDLKEKFWSFWNKLFQSPDEDGGSDARREKIFVFLVAFVMALCLWLMVNLSRDYNLNINLPIRLGNMPPDRALAEELPNFVTVSITGEGWKLINIYNNPPQIFVDVTQDEINLYDQVQQQINATPELNVQKVQPLFLNLDLEEKISKKVPVTSRVQVTFQDQYGFVGTPTLKPDSVTVSGAVSLVRNITAWETDSVKIGDIHDDVSKAVPLKTPPSLLSLSQEHVDYTGEVAQYTEGEVRVIVQTRNLPRGRSVSYSPTAITVRYDVPINEYADVSDMQTPVVAYVNYNQLYQDSTGFVVPQVEQSSTNNYHLKIRSFQPREVAYFMVVEN